jgi:hypothetical protein
MSRHAIPISSICSNTSLTRALRAKREERRGELRVMALTMFDATRYRGREVDFVRLGCTK